MKKGLLILVMVSVASFTFYACTKTPIDQTPTSTDGYDKKAMLAYYADNLVVPGYKALQDKVSAFKTTLDNFTAAPSVAKQATLKDAYKEMYLQYQRVAIFQFGPAETNLLDNYLNFSGGLDYSFTTAGQYAGFSIDTATIEGNITSGNYNLSTASRSTLYAQGFPALDYLCFSPGAIDKINADPTNRKKYIGDVLERIKTLIDATVNGWSTYRADFTTNTQSNVGSPIGNMVNQLCYQMDMLKGPRIGWPFGKQSNGIVFANKCEGYYAGISLPLAIENLTNMKNVFTANASGKGISDYIIALKNEQLSKDVVSQFDLAIGKLQAIPGPLSEAFTANPTAVDAAYKEVQKLVTLLKTDVASATAVQITYVDNDGD